tara:strand:- start:8656 stop:13632 length:4977 start_codon:yes stop_codon:yes gene_type:complete
MSFNPIKIVKKVFNKAVDLVQDVVGAVGDMADWVMDEIVDPVFDAIQDVDLWDVAKVAAAVYAPWAIPLISGAEAIDQGGDLGDAFKAAAISYVSAEAGAMAGDYVGTAVGEATGSQIAETITTAAISGGTRESVGAIAYGEDPLKAFIAGGVSAGLSAAMGEIDTLTGAKLEGVVDEVTGETIVQQVGGAFSKLPPTAQNIIKDSLAAVATGQDIDAGVLAGAIARAHVTTDLVSAFIGDNVDLEAAEIAAITLAVQRSAAAAASGGSISDAVMQTVTQYGQNEFNKVAGETVRTGINKVSGAYQNLTEAVDKIDATGAERMAVAEEYNALKFEYDAAYEVRRAAKEDFDDAKANFEANSTFLNQEIAMAANAVQKEADNAFSKVYDEILPQLEPLELEYDRLNDLIQTYEVDLSAAQDELVSGTSLMSEEFVPLFGAIDKAFVLGMVPDFDEESYRKFNSIPEGEDAYFHWLTIGKDENLPTNETEYENAFNRRRTQLINQTLGSQFPGLTIASISENEVKRVISNIDEKYSTLAELNDASYVDVAQLMLQDAGEAFVQKWNHTAYNTWAENNPELVPTGGGVDKELDEDGKVIVEFAANTTLTPEIMDLLGRLDPSYITDGMEGEQLTDAELSILNSAMKPPTAAQEFVIDSLSLDQETAAMAIASNQASVQLSPNGLKKWGETVYKSPEWSEKYGQMVYRYEYTQLTGGVLQSQSEEYEGTGIGIYKDGEATGQVGVLYKTLDNDTWLNAGNPDLIDFEDSSLADAGLTLKEIKDADPTQFSTIAAGLIDFNDGVGQVGADVKNALVENYGDAVYEGLRNVKVWTESAHNQEDDSKNWYLDAVGSATKGVGGILEFTNDAVSLMLGYDPNSGSAIKMANAISNFGGDITSQAFKDQVKVSSANVADAEGAYATLLAFGTEITDTNGSYLTAIVFEELSQELLPALVTRGTSLFTRGLAKESLEQLGQEVATKWADDLALGAGAATDIIESFGGSAGGMYDESYDYLIAAGYSEDEAELLAYDRAIASGTAASVFTLGSFGVGGLDYDKYILGRTTKSAEGNVPWTEFTQRVSNNASIVIGEAGSEALEEGASTYVDELILHDLDPDRDIWGNVAAGAAIGAVAGAGTVGGAMAVGSILSKTNSTIHNIVANAPPTPEGAIAAGEQLAAAGLTDSVITNNILNEIDPDSYTSTADVQYLFKEINPDYVGSMEEFESFVASGSPTDSNQIDPIKEYINENYIDIDEVKLAAKAQGITLDDEQALAYVQQINQKEAEAAITAEYNPQGTTETELMAAFERLGYTDEERDQFTNSGGVRNVERLEKLKQIEIDKYTGAIRDDELDELLFGYVDPRQLTQEEKDAYVKELGYTPEGDELDELLSPSNFNMGLNTEYEKLAKRELKQFIDPFVVDSNEAKKAYEDLGLFDVQQGDIDKLTGQYSESEVAGRAKDNLTTAQLNSVSALLGKPERFITDADINFISDLLAQDAAISEIQTSKYDVTGDSLVDQADITAMQGVIDSDADAQTEFYNTLNTTNPNSVFGAATGINAALNTQTDLNTDLNTQINTLIDTNITQRQQEKEVEKEEEIFDMVSQKGRGSTSEGEIAKIDYIYDFEDMLANPEQRSKYAFSGNKKPTFSTGGQVMSENDILLKLIGEN